MPIRRGEQFLESLRDGRQVWVRGEKVDDVTTHPALAGFAKSLAEVYDLQHDPAHQEQLTMKSPSTGEVVSLGYLLPHSTEDLIRVRHMTEFLQRRCGGSRRPTSPLHGHDAGRLVRPPGDSGPGRSRLRQQCGSIL